MDCPLFAHTLEALRKAKQIEEEQMLDGTLIRAGYRRRRREQDQITPRFLNRQTNIDWWAPSPLVTFDRNTTNYRIPTLLITPISKVAVPRGPAGETHPSYPDPQASIEGHYSYIERQERAARTALDHGDYIERGDARDIYETGEISHVCTNIHRNPEKRRAFAKAVYKRERLGRIHKLEARTDDVEWWQVRAADPTSPDWVKQAYRVLRKKAAEHARKAAQSGKSAVPVYVPILNATERQAYDRIVWCEAQPGWDTGRHNLVFKSAPGGRVQYRFVYQLPYWMTAAERFENVRKMARHLGKRGFMYVAAIHRPDAHNDPRNFHVHIDAYDRPCRFKKSVGLWDFEVTEKKRNGSIRYPYRQNKIAGFARSEEGVGHREHGEQVIASLRQTFCDFTNEILERSTSPLRYHPGPFEAIGLKLRATRKLGGKAMASEAIGLRTAGGDNNAVAIWSDVFDGVHRDRAEALDRVRSWHKDATSRLVEVSDPGERDDLRKRVARALEDERALIERRYRFELGQAEIQMMRSRAETVRREANKRAAAKAANGAFRKSKLARLYQAAPREAEQHLVLIDRLSPDPDLVKAEEVAIAKRQHELATERATIAADVRGAVKHVPVQDVRGIRRLGPTTVAIDPSLSARHAAPASMGRYDRLEVERLLAWFKKAGGEADRYQFGEADITLRAPQAVCTRLVKHWGRPELMAVLGNCIAAARRGLEGQLAPHNGHDNAGTAPPGDRRLEAARTPPAGNKRIGQERLRQLSKGPTAAPAQRRPTKDVTPSANSAAQKTVPRPASSSVAAAHTAPVSAFTAPGDQSSSKPGGPHLSNSPAAPSAPLPVPARAGIAPTSTPSEYIRLDADFVAAERAAGRSVQGDDLRFWRQVMTAEERPVLTSPFGGTPAIQIIVNDDPTFVEIVSRRLERTASDLQLSRYLRTMVPTLPKVRPGELGLAAIQVTLHSSLLSEQELSAEVSYAASLRDGNER